MTNVTTHLNRDGSFDIKFVVDFDDLNNLCREQLLLMKSDIENVPCMSEVSDALDIVIAYCSSAEQLQEMLNS